MQETTLISDVFQVEVTITRYKSLLRLILYSFLGLLTASFRVKVHLVDINYVKSVATISYHFNFTTKHKATTYL